MATKLALTFCFIGWILLAFSCLSGIATVGNATLQVVATCGLIAGSTVLAAGILIGVMCVIKLIWED